MAKRIKRNKKNTEIKKRNLIGGTLQQIFAGTTPSITNDITTTDNSLEGSNSPNQYIIDKYKDQKKLIIRGADLFEVSYSNGISITKLGSFPDGLGAVNDKQQDNVAYDPVTNRLARIRRFSTFVNSTIHVGVNLDIFNLDTGGVTLYGSYNEDSAFTSSAGYNYYRIVYASNAEGFVLIRARIANANWQRLMWGAAFIDPAAATLTASYTSFMSTSTFYNGISRAYYSESLKKIYVLGHYREFTTQPNDQKSEISSFIVNDDGTFTTTLGGDHYYGELASLAGIKVSEYQSSFFEYNGKVGFVYMDKEISEADFSTLYSLKMVLFDLPSSSYSVHSNIIIDDNQYIRSPMGASSPQLDSWATTVSIVSNNYLFVAYPLLAVNMMDTSVTQSKIKIAKINLTDNSVEVREVGEGLKNYYGYDSTPFVFTNLGENTDTFLLSIIPDNYAAPFASFENHLISPFADNPRELISAQYSLTNSESETITGYTNLEPGKEYYIGEDAQPTTTVTSYGKLGVAIDTTSIKTDVTSFASISVNKLTFGEVTFEPDADDNLLVKNTSTNLALLKNNGELLIY